jgi:hypothetical protein
MDKKVGDTFIDSFFRRWKIVTVGKNFYDCQFIEFLDGNIPCTPKFQIFNFDEFLASKNINSGIG